MCRFGSHLNSAKIRAKHLGKQARRDLAEWQSVLTAELTGDDRGRMNAFGARRGGVNKHALSQMKKCKDAVEEGQQDLNSILFINALNADLIPRCSRPNRSAAESRCI